MARATPLITNFTSGEISARMRGRIDQARYFNACLTMENFIVTTEGPAERIPGTRFIAEVKDSAKRTALMPFEFNAEQAYQIEPGDQYFRFYKDKARIESPPGTPIEIASPYLQADLFDAAGELLLKHAQSNDVLYLVHPLYAPRKLSRTSHTVWTLTEIAFQDGPYLDANSVLTKTIAPSATTGAITLTAAGHTPFVSTDVGRLVRVGHQAAAWAATTAYVAGDIRRNSGNVYLCTAAGTSGSVGPTGIGDEIVEGTVTWRWLNEGGVRWGWAVITGFTSTTVVNATVMGAFGAATASNNWRLGLWSPTTGRPRAVSFHEQGLWFAGAASFPGRFDQSHLGDFENFAPGTEADEARSYTLSSDQANVVQWLRSLDALLIGTRGAEWRFLTEPNLSAKRQASRGSQALSVTISDEVLFVQAHRRKVYKLAYSFERDKYVPGNLTQLAAHITLSGIVSVAYQQEPWSILWAARKDGVLIGLTYVPEQQVIGWHRHPKVNGAVEAVSCIPGANGDELWMTVRRTINGVTKRYVEVLENATGEDGLQEDAWYVDCALSYSGVATNVLSNLGHLEGQLVQILGDGAVHPPKIVTAGAITLEAGVTVTKAQVGLGYTSILQPMPLEAGAVQGTAQGQMSRISKIMVRFFRSLGCKVGRDAAHLEELVFRSASDPMDVAPPLFTGDKTVTFPGDWKRAAEVMVVQDQPLPCMVVALAPKTQVNEG